MSIAVELDVRVVSTVAGWLIWPRSSHVTLCATAAAVVRTVAAIVSAPDQSTPRLEQVARQKLMALQQGFVAALSLLPIAVSADLVGQQRR
jgi:hypothetical protein